MVGQRSGIGPLNKQLQGEFATIVDYQSRYRVVVTKDGRHKVVEKRKRR